MPMKKLLSKFLVLFSVGGTIYFLIELIYKSFISNGIVHWSMFLLGGFCFILIGLINEHLPWEMSIIKQGIIGTVIVTVLEFLFGVVLNIILKLGIWDYSHLPLNILGQVCLPFSLAWFFLALIAIMLDDYLRWKWFGEDKPHYHIKDHEPCE